jgi:hypothetical protein
MNLVASVPALYESAATHYEAWERAINGFAVGRIGQPADSLFALTGTRALSNISRKAGPCASKRW